MNDEVEPKAKKNSKEDFKEDFSFLAKKISSLLIEKNMSERQFSLELGHSPSYINGITSGNARPSLNELLYICKYFNIAPKYFFDEDVRVGSIQMELVEITQDIELSKLNELLEIFKELRLLKDDDLYYILSLSKRLNES